MTFEHPIFALLAILPAVWAAVSWRGESRPWTLCLKGAAFALILLALSGPAVRFPETKVAVAILADTSSSVSGEGLSEASRIASAIGRRRGRNWTTFLSFARMPRAIRDDELGDLQHTPGEDGQATDLEMAVREGITMLPPGLVPRLVLISDGHENSGSVARAIWQARELGIPVDTYAIAGRAEPNLRLESATASSVAFTGEKIPVDLVIDSPFQAKGSVEMFAEGHSLGSHAIVLGKGENPLRVNASVSAAGAVSLAGAVRASRTDGRINEIRFNRAITLRRPRVLYISTDPPGTGTNLLQALAAAKFDVVQATGVPAANLSDYQLVVLNNENLESIPPGAKAALESFVQQGGGLLVIGGERNVYPERPHAEDALDRVLPAKIAPPRTPEGTCVILIIDKSSSMEGKKIELARLAAIGVIDNLRPIDRVGVLIFDNSFEWAVPLRHAEDKSLIKRLVSGITPDGGTQIAPALSEAYQKILPVNATYKHIVLLTDGISEEGDSLDLSREALKRRVTISTVGLGQDVNRAYLEKIASFAGGKSYFLSDPSGLQQILLRDVMEHTGSTAIEEDFRPVIAKQAEILDGVGMESAPPLKGYVRFIAKPTAETILAVNDRDPLLVRWQYGLGRAAVFTSDAKSRWAANWVTWKGYDRFWTNLFRDLLPRSQDTDAKADYDSASGDLVVNYTLGRNEGEPPAIPEVFVFGPGGFEKPLPLQKVAAGAFRGRVAIGGRQGLFRVRPLAESHVFPETGFYRDEQESRDYGTNEFLLRQVASFTGGRFNPSPSQVFDPAGRSIRSSMRLWPLLLALAILCDLLELVMRKAANILPRFLRLQAAR